MKLFVFKVGYTYRGFNSVAHVCARDFSDAEFEVHRMYTHNDAYYSDHPDVIVLFLERVSEVESDPVSVEFNEE